MGATTAVGFPPPPPPPPISGGAKRFLGDVGVAGFESGRGVGVVEESCRVNETMSNDPPIYIRLPVQLYPIQDDGATLLMGETLLANLILRGGTP